MIPWSNPKIPIYSAGAQQQKTARSKVEEFLMEWNGPALRCTRLIESRWIFVSLGKSEF
jgi:hypothetical protein